MIHEVTNYFTQSINSYFDTMCSTMNTTSTMDLSHFIDGNGNNDNDNDNDINIDNKHISKNNHTISINSNNYMKEQKQINYFNLREEDLVNQESSGDQESSADQDPWDNVEGEFITFTTDEISASNTLPVEKPLLYENEPHDEQEVRRATIRHLYRMVHNEFETHSEMQHLLGLRIQKGDIDSMILQESRLLSIFQIAANLTANGASNIGHFCKASFEKYLLGRKCVSIWTKCNKQLTSYGLPISSLYGSQNKDPFTMFANNNTIRGFRNRLYWNEKEKEYISFGMIKRHVTTLPFRM